MNYNIEFIEIKYALINVFLIGADSNILDVSYSNEGNTMMIQVVLLKGTNMSLELRNKLHSFLTNFEIQISEVFLSKGSFNENRGEWLPKHYQWLEHLLFSKAEVL